MLLVFHMLPVDVFSAADTRSNDRVSAAVFSAAIGGVTKRVFTQLVAIGAGCGSAIVSTN